VGANYAQDAAYLADSSKIVRSDVNLLDAHPVIASALTDKYRFEVNQKAVLNINGCLTFNAVNISQTSNSEVQSLLKHSVNDSVQIDAITVEVIRLDDLVRVRGISKIDFLKVDVEGMAFEVLDGLGEFIHNVSCIQIETEVMPAWENQWTQTEVFVLLETKGFQKNEHITQKDTE
jgi:FkbM family methyltransferase